MAFCPSYTELMGEFGIHHMVVVKTRHCTRIVSYVTAHSSASYITALRNVSVLFFHNEDAVPNGLQCPTLPNCTLFLNPCWPAEDRTQPCSQQGCMQHLSQVRSERQSMSVIVKRIKHVTESVTILQLSFKEQVELGRIVQSMSFSRKRCT